MTLGRPLLRSAVLLGILIPLLLGVAASCSPIRHIMMTASPTGYGPVAQPPLPALDDGLEAWRAQRGLISDRLNSALYGIAPPDAEVRATHTQMLDENAYNGAGTLEVVELELTLPNGALAHMALALALPKTAPAPAPIVLIPGECGLQIQLGRNDLPAPRGGVAGYCQPGDGFVSNFIGGFFGDYVVRQPVEQILRRGYGLAAWHESDIAPDSASRHDASLRALNLDPETADRPGTLSLWAWMMSEAADYLQTDTRIDPERMALMGHSRRAKAVLLAAARDERFSAVISHQSGTGGASLHRDSIGEPIASITERYPHWFAPAYADFIDREDEMDFDAHYLLALIAPRSVLLGNARRDVWSDPAGAWRAAQAASPVWDLYGTDGLNQRHLNQMDVSGSVAFHIRPETHGVRDVDWEAFLEFLDERL